MRQKEKDTWKYGLIQRNEEYQNLQGNYHVDFKCLLKIIERVRLLKWLSEKPGKSYLSKAMIKLEKKMLRITTEGHWKLTTDIQQI